MRLPPYGLDVAKNPKNVFIYAGIDAWTAGRSRANHVGKNSVMVLPPGEDSRKYHWPVQGMELMLIWPDGSLSDVQDFGKHLVLCGSPSVIVPTLKDAEGCLFIKPIQRAVA